MSSEHSGAGSPVIVRGMSERTQSGNSLNISGGDPDEHVLDLKDLHCDEKNLVMFRKKHLFVEMHELNEKDKEWHETHRWNYGLEEELVPPKSDTEESKWTNAHLPTISVFGMMALRECLKAEYIYLDMQPEHIWEGTDDEHDVTVVFQRTLRLIAIKIVNRCVKDGKIEPGHATSALDILWTHLDCKKCIDHDVSLMKERALAVSHSRRGLSESSPYTGGAENAMPQLHTQGSKTPGSFQRITSLLKPRLSQTRLVSDDGTKMDDSLSQHCDTDQTTTTHDERGQIIHTTCAAQIFPPELTDIEKIQATQKLSPPTPSRSHDALHELAKERHVMIEDPVPILPRNNSKKKRLFEASRSEGNLFKRGAMSEGNIMKAMPTKPRKKKSSAYSKFMEKKIINIKEKEQQQVVIKIKEDPLRPDAEEEAVHIMIDDNFDELKSDVVVLVRLQAPVISGLEECAGSDDLEMPSQEEEKFNQVETEETTTSDELKNNNEEMGMLARAVSTPNLSEKQNKKKKHMQQDLLARFLVLVLGPKKDHKAQSAAKRYAKGKEVPSLYRRRHQEMGAAVAALMQDDAIVRALYEAKVPSELIEAIDLKLSAMRILPRTSRPTKAAVKHRAANMYKQLAEIRRVAEEQAKAQQLLQQQKDNGDITPTAQLVELNYTGGRFIRLEYPDQGAKWGAREKDSFTAGFSISAVLIFCQKYALPLMAGITLALILANTRAGGYRRWAGVTHDDHDDDHDDHHITNTTDHHHHRYLSSSSHGGHPTAFGLEVNDHDVTIHFLVNDVFMSFFFGIAIKEITEAVQPGGSLYPPTSKAVNPMLGTLGAVLGPILFYFLLCAIAVSTGIVGAFSFSDLAQGWGVPTATDISVAWVTAVVVFGAGHPAINYLLLCAVIDDGIGLLIIAIFYPDPENPLKPIWLLLVIVAMLISYILRKLQCARWQVYVFLAGPIAWFGLLYAAIHPSLALCFVVPFMPIKIEHATDDLKDRLNNVGPDGHLVDAHHRGSPLHDFEEGVKDFVDFFVLFAFAAVNAGVRFDDIGPFSAVVFLALVIGKTIGLTLGSQIGVWLGFPRPPGMSFQHLVISGVICGVGLTVALFIAGEAFSDDEVLEGQAKLGALLSLGPALVLVALANLSPKLRKFIVGNAPNIQHAHFDPMLESIPDSTDTDNLDRSKHTDTTSKHGDIAISSGLQGDGIAASPTNIKNHTDAIDYTIDYDDSLDKDEFLEDVVVSNIEASLQEIHQIQTQVERKAGVRRSSQMIEGVRRAHHEPY